MVAISFSALGYEFERGVGAIEQMYLSAHEALALQRKNWNRRLAAINRGEPSAEFGPETEFYSPEKLIEHELAGIENLLQLLRQSTLLMGYHFWEKQVLRWGAGLPGRPTIKITHDSYISYCGTQNLAVDAGCLNTLRLIANVVKHGQGKQDWANRLWDARPDLFIANPKSADYPYDLLSFSHDLVFNLLTGLSTSGPSAFSNFVPTRLDMIS